MDSEFILDVIEKQLHPKEVWAFYKELRVGTGYGNNVEQRVDAWAINYFPSNQCKRVAYEVKVSRSDFLSELKKPRKKAMAMLYSNEYYFATPKGLIKPEELPIDCGLYEIDERGFATKKFDAPHRESFPPSWRFIGSILRRSIEQLAKENIVEKTEELERVEKSALRKKKQNIAYLNAQKKNLEADIKILKDRYQDLRIAYEQ